MYYLLPVSAAMFLTNGIQIDESMMTHIYFYNTIPWVDLIIFQVLMKSNLFILIVVHEKIET